MPAREKPAGPGEESLARRRRRARLTRSTLLSPASPISTPISFACNGATIWAGFLPPICRAGCWQKFSPSGFRSPRSAISIGRRCGLSGNRRAAGRIRIASPSRPATRQRKTGVGLKAGALLVREWNGVLQRVMVLEKGFAWNGRTYGSLSQIAKAMTGTSWNGHRFFGLRPASSGARVKSESIGRPGRTKAHLKGSRDEARSKRIP